MKRTVWIALAVMLMVLPLAGILWGAQETAKASQVGPPTGLMLKITKGGVELAWKASPQDPGIVTGYEIERAVIMSGPFEKIGAVGKGVLTYQDKTAQKEAVYFYRVRAVAGKEYSAYSKPVTGERAGF